MNRLIPVFAALLLASCAAPVTVPTGTYCETPQFVIDDDFEGARRGDCTVLSANRVRLSIEPEDAKVRNPSPWYAFRVEPRGEQWLRVELDYGTWEHRYAPKISTDGQTWFHLSPDNVTISDDESMATIRLEPLPKPYYVAAHELLMPYIYDNWSRAKAESTEFELSVVGQSIEGRDIQMLAAGNPANPTVLLTGGQHPPEVSGRVAFLTFADTVFGDSSLARQFRSKFRVIAVPLMNPDGVIAGHWRHNLGETDLNRDWGPFEQPETQVIPRILDNIESAGSSPVAFIDFHSTRDNKFFTQAEPTEPADFSSRWVERSLARLEDFEFKNDPRPQSATPNGKNYMYKRYGIPSLTYEVADEEDRGVVKESARVFAEEFMRLWLEVAANEPTAE